jgi:glycerol uptake facilitator protein
MRIAIWREIFGEALGTFVLVFIGCGSVGAAVILGWLSALWQVALVWGVGVTLAIKASDRWCPAHLNPAVTLAMCIGRAHSWRRLLPYWIAQLTGALLAGLALLKAFTPAINAYEQKLLGTDADIYPFVGPLRSAETAQMFGEFFPNPGFAQLIDIPWPLAFLAEGLSAFLLLFMIFRITEHIHRLSWGVAMKIGLTVSVLIILFAPLTQCGMNPARDLGPRIIAYFNGWGTQALNQPLHSNLSVYVIAPLLGGALAAWGYNRKKHHSAENR